MDSQYIYRISDLSRALERYPFAMTTSIVQPDDPIHHHS